MCGVRQGEVLSPLLFSVYVNDMIKTLCDKNLNWMLCWWCLLWLCYVCRWFGSITVNLLQRMIDTCCEEAVYKVKW